MIHNPSKFGSETRILPLFFILSSRHDPLAFFPSGSNWTQFRYESSTFNHTRVFICLTILCFRVVDPWLLVRIRIRGFVPLTYGSGSCSFCQWLTRYQQEISFFFKVFLLITVLFEGTSTSVFIDKKSKRSHKIVEIKAFLTFFACWSASVQNNDGSGSTTLLCVHCCTKLPLPHGQVLCGCASGSEQPARLHRLLLERGRGHRPQERTRYKDGRECRLLCRNFTIADRLNMALDLQSLFGLHITWCTQLYSLAETPQLLPSLRIWTRIRGRYWSAKTDDISL